ncbi:MAG: VWA domain-containing protein [Anaerolineae bacterium]|jgi:hypothetical protein|nr:VWA domain-containing protein [Anaerolineae bacterium]
MEMKGNTKHERGGVLLLLALSLIVLIGLLALAIDIGVGYAARRKVQNAVDAGALAAAVKLADHESDSVIYAVIEQYTIVENEAHTFEAFYIAEPGGPVLATVGEGAIPLSATGIRINATLTTPTYFAQLLGFDTLTVEASGGGGFGKADIMLVLDRSGSMDDDSCSWQPYPPTGGRECYSPVNETNCTDCYVLSGSRRVHGTWGSPLQPITAAKNAANLFVDLNNPHFTYIGVASYADDYTLNRTLSNNYAGVKTAISNLVADGCTNAAGGLYRARQELTGVHAREGASRFVVFLTDGLPNQGLNSSQSCSSCPDYCPVAKTAARNQAILAAEDNIIIFTIALGNKADQALMRDIADLTGGGFYYAPTSDELASIYEEIFEQIRLRLIE